MSDKSMSKRLHGFARHIRRFFWLPRDTPRHPSAAVPQLRVCLFLLAMGAFAAAVDWDEGTFAMTIGAVWSMLDDVIKGVRLRWPAFVAGLAVGWGVNRLAHAAVSSAGSPWGEYAVHAATTVAVLATFVGVSRLPRRRELRPSGA